MFHARPLIKSLVLVVLKTKSTEAVRRRRLCSLQTTIQLSLKDRVLGFEIVSKPRVLRLSDCPEC